MFISKKKHNKIIEEHNKVNVGLFRELQEKETEIKQGHEKHLEIVAGLKKELEDARNLSKILDKLSSTSIFGMDWGAVGGTWRTANLPDNVLQYTEDILGGKVIKQEGTKCLVIDSKGDVKTGLTKQKADKGYSYKLVRQPNF